MIIICLDTLCFLGHFILQDQKADNLGKHGKWGSLSTETPHSLHPAAWQERGRLLRVHLKVSQTFPKLAQLIINDAQVVLELPLQNFERLLMGQLFLVESFEGNWVET